MFANGVSHACVRNDLEGVAAMLQWLSYVPERRGAPLPITRLVREDPVDRDVMYINDPSVLSDPRFLLTGLNNEVCTFLFGRKLTWSSRHTGNWRVGIWAV